MTQNASECCSGEVIIAVFVLGEQYHINKMITSDLAYSITPEYMGSG